ncbi:MAG: aminotransferase class V-fold PLP-dependent enzyme [Bryobacteraceae bacterium]
MAARTGTSRRNMIGAGLAAGGAAWTGMPEAAAGSMPNVYESIGVRPVINCKGTFTIVSGSQTLPEVKQAMDAASRHYVHLDELMDGVGRRLAELTKAEWGIVTAGCAAALTHATSACVAGANPERMQRLPDLTGLKNEVVMPLACRNVYDHAIRMVGVKMVTPATREEFLASLRPSTAMVALLGEAMDRNFMTVAEVADAAHKQGIPILVDAAAEKFSVPNSYLKDGADMVAYSGGKSLRGPQCAGVLLGRKDLLQSAWINSAPHHAFGRSLKVGKEEIMGMLAAVEMWTRRDHEAEWKQWLAWLHTISGKVKTLPGVNTEILQPNGVSNVTPSLRISWDNEKLPWNGEAAAEALLQGMPRILVPGQASSLTVTPWMMMPGDDRIAAIRSHEVLSKPPASAAEPPPAIGTQLAGAWDVDIAFLRGPATHTIFIEQTGGRLAGTHRGEFLSGDLHGKFDGKRARFGSSHRYEGTSIGYQFDGVLDGGLIRGSVDLGEYGKANFTARRHFRA